MIYAFLFVTLFQTRDISSHCSIRDIHYGLFEDCSIRDISCGLFEDCSIRDISCGLFEDCSIRDISLSTVFTLFNFSCFSIHYSFRCFFCQVWWFCYVSGFWIIDFLHVICRGFLNNVFRILEWFVLMSFSDILLEEILVFHRQI